MKTTPLNFLFVLFVGFACTPTGSEPATEQAAATIPDFYANAFERMPETEACSIVREAVEKAGGWKAWLDKSSVRYDKVITSYDSTGEVTRKYTQVHEYNLFPEFKARISWEMDGNQYVILNNNQQAWKLENGEIMTDQDHINSAYNSSYGSHYTFFMPFKLADPGTNLQYDGIVTLPNGKETHQIFVTYEEGAGSAAAYHKWWYFFDTETMELAANMISSGGFGYTEYLGMMNVEGLKIAKARNSHSSDSLRTDIQLRTNYENQNVQFGEPFPDSYFEPAEEE